MGTRIKWELTWRDETTTHWGTVIQYFESGLMRVQEDDGPVWVRGVGREHEVIG